MMSTVIVRTALALVAVVVLGWLAVSYRDAHRQQQAEAILRPQLARYLSTGEAPAGERAQLDRATDLIDGARLLNPDRTLDLVAGSLELLTGRTAAARRRFERFARAEPDNLQAWLALDIATARSDPRRAREALRRAAEVDPLRLGSR
jgi:tetratricopeptide (TPR) repeat protein